MVLYDSKQGTQERSPFLLWPRAVQKRQKLSPSSSVREVAVLVLPHATSAGHFAAHTLNRTRESFSISTQRNVGQSFFSTRVDSVVSTSVEPTPSRNGFVRRHFLPFWTAQQPAAKTNFPLFPLLDALQAYIGLVENRGHISSQTADRRKR